MKSRSGSLVVFEEIVPNVGDLSSDLFEMRCNDHFPEFNDRRWNFSVAIGIHDALCRFAKLTVYGADIRDFTQVLSSSSSGFFFGHCFWSSLHRGIVRDIRFIKLDGDHIE